MQDASLIRARQIAREAAIENSTNMDGLWAVTGDHYSDGDDAVYTVEDLVDLAIHHDTTFRHEPGNRRVVDESGTVVAIPANEVIP